MYGEVLRKSLDHLMIWDVPIQLKYSFSGLILAKRLKAPHAR